MPSGSFKIPCPSCEAGVLVRDDSMIGKKIDCPKCKYRFVVEAPNGQEKAVAVKKPPAAGAKAKGAPPAKTTAKTKPAPKAAAEDEGEGEDRPKKKKTAASNKMVLRLALAGVGVIVLVVAGILLFKKGDTPKTSPGSRTPPPNIGQANSNPSTDEPKKQKKTDKVVEPPAPRPVAFVAAGPELTNLLPADAQHVLHVFVKDVLDPNTLLGAAAFQPSAGQDKNFKEHLGFTLSDIDDLIRAENYSQAWTLTLVHVRKAVDEKALRDALGLQAATGSPMNQKDFSQVTKNNPWIEQLARLSVGTLPPASGPAKAEDRPLLVRIHDPNTLVFADAAPMKAFLGMSGPAGMGETYATLKPELKAMLQKLEKAPADLSDGRVLFSAVTDMDKARMDVPPGGVPWRFKPIWDVAQALPDDPQRITMLGAALLRKGTSEPAVYRYVNELECTSDADSRSVQKDLQTKVAPAVERFFDMLLGLKLEIAGAEPEQPAPGAAAAAQANPRPGFARQRQRKQINPGGTAVPPAPAPGQPMAPGVKEPTKIHAGVSHINVVSTEKSVVFTLNLASDVKVLPRLAAIADLFVAGVRGQLEATAGVPHRKELAQAEKKLGEKGVPDRGVPSGTYPRGLFPLKAATAKLPADPNQRISWMAALLPYLGQENLYARIQFDASWRNPANWMPAGTTIPEFLDPTYPDQAHFALYPGIPFRLGGTHFVGIGGIGRDAPDYVSGDPAVAAKLGVFGYDRMTSLLEIKKSRGLANTAVMIQVPYNGPAGVTPWMAGGGSTIRGVPNKDSIKPFVSTTENDKAGTYVLMADGSVKFIPADVNDEVFKAMCTIKAAPNVSRLD